MRRRAGRVVAVLLATAGWTMADRPAFAGDPEHSVARRWNEVLLECIRNDFARPTVHAISAGLKSAMAPSTTSEIFSISCCVYS